jgi:ATP-dependent protease ClpP protease subunit
VEYNYAIAPYSQNPVFLLDNYIGDYGIDGKVFARELFEIDRIGAKNITIYVNSLGGSVEHAYDIYNSIEQAKTPITVCIYGFAYSSAGWCILPANRIEMVDYGSWMCHKAYNSMNPDEKSPMLDKVNNSISVILAGKSGRAKGIAKTVGEVMAMMEDETFYTADEMYAAGWCDEVIRTGVQNSAGDINTKYAQFGQILNSKINNHKQINSMNTNQIANYLGIDAGSGEQAIINSIADLKNSNKALSLEKDRLSNAATEAVNAKEIALTELRNAQTKVADLTTINSDLQNKVNEGVSKIASTEATNTALVASNNDLREKLATVENKAKEEAEKAFGEKCTAMVNGYVDAGKIKSEDADKYVNMANKSADNYENVDLMLGSLPTTFTAVPKPANAGAANIGPDAFSYFQNGLKNK